MDRGLDIIEIIFIVIFIIYSVYQVFYSKKAREMAEEIKGKMKPDSHVMIIRYLSFITVNSIFVNMIFDIEWLLAITFISVIGLGLLVIEHKFDKSFVISVFLFILFFLTFNVPTHPASFERYMSETAQYECLRIHCVKITEVITPEDTLETEAKVLLIEGSRFDWYLLFAKGALTLKDEDGNYEEFTGINIGGLWLTDN